MTPYFFGQIASIKGLLIFMFDLFKSFSKKCLPGVAVWRSVLFRASLVKSFSQMVAAMRSSSEN